jgi:hypothetical protein
MTETDDGTAVVVLVVEDETLSGFWPTTHSARRATASSKRKMGGRHSQFWRRTLTLEHSSPM